MHAYSQQPHRLNTTHSHASYACQPDLTNPGFSQEIRPIDRLFSRCVKAPVYLPSANVCFFVIMLFPPLCARGGMRTCIYGVLVCACRA